MKTNQKGFSVLEVLVVVVIVGLIGAVIWLVYDRQKSKTPETLSSQSSNRQPAEVKSEDRNQTAEQAMDETSNWKQESNTELEYSYKFPDDGNWKTFVVKTVSGSQEYSSGERMNNAGVNYIQCGKNCGLAFSLRVYVKGSSADPGSNWGETEMQDNNFYKLSSKKTVTQDGVAGTRWEYQPSDTSAGSIVYYYFAKGNLSYIVRVNDNGSKTEKIDITERGEKILSTLKFTN